MRNHPWMITLGLALLCACTPFSRAADRPNFLFILVDDLGWADVEPNGSTFHQTPNITRLAAGGMNFTDGYAACPVCSPTRASIMTGRHPVRVNITDWIPGGNPQNRPLLAPEDRRELALEEVTIAEVLKAAGYATFFAGKWHLGSTGFFPEDQGFDINKGGHHKGSPPGGYYAPYKNPKLENGPDGEYLPDRLTDETIAFMQASKDQPFLAYLSFYTVHTPIQASKRHIKETRRRAAELPGETVWQAEHQGQSRMRQDNPDYASMVEAMDENVGRLLDGLAETGLEDNTVVLFMSDNGGLCTVGGRRGPTCNLPLRAGKGWCYEGGIREPMIIRAPGVTRPGTTCAVPVQSTDFFPTILELAGLPLQPKLHADGQSMLPYLKGRTATTSRPLFWHFPHYHGSTWTPGAAVRDGDWKLIEFYDPPKAELYHLGTDIGEQKELSDTHPDKKQELLDLLHAWQKQLGARMPKPNPKYKP